jgi:hypothetical protein
MTAPDTSAPSALVWTYADIQVLEGKRWIFPPSEHRALLSLARASDGQLRIGAGSDLGHPDAPLQPEKALTLLSPTGQTVTGVILADADARYLICDVTPFPGADYRRLAAPADGRERALKRLPSTAFARGTRLTMGNGAQTPIEDVRPGARVMTRDCGPQTVLRTRRFTAALRPVRIAADVLGNPRPLTLTQDHRLFLPQNPDDKGPGRPRLAVKARHLVDGRSITSGPRVVVQIVQMLFATHQVVFAEGIAAESRLLPERCERMLPANLLARLEHAACASTCATQPHRHAAALLRRPDAFQIIRQLAAE